LLGDRIYTIRTHPEKWPKYPDMGMVRVSHEVFKMPGEPVLYCEHLQTVKYRDASTFRPTAAEMKSLTICKTTTLHYLFILSCTS